MIYRIEEERYHTFLALSYIDHIYKIYPKEKKFSEINTDSPDLKEYKVFTYFFLILIIF